MVLIDWILEMVFCRMIKHTTMWLSIQYNKCPTAETVRLKTKKPAGIAFLHVHQIQYVRGRDAPSTCYVVNAVTAHKIRKYF